jgi:acyl-coenzyme A synthetase/AMP-(fatty) acid ligase
MGPHRTIVNRLQWDARPSDADEVYAQKTTANFIDALWELFMPLTRGQHVAIVPEQASKDPQRLIETLAFHEASRIVLVPSLLQAVLESGENLSRRLPRLRYWACSGEALSAELAERFASRIPDAVLLNIYGTSEFWDASWHEVERGPDGCGAPIGHPLSNMQVHVLDAELQPTPIGVPGEICIGGAGLARGYLGRPGLTAERFIANPFGEGERLYRTGDVGRWRADGNLEFVGRIDHQVKVRGFRIELGEIEAALLGHAGVKQAVVLAREDAPGDKRLVAYVVATGAAAVDAGELRAHLKRSLPEYMFPSAYVKLVSLPLTPNGKVDRRGLPAPVDDAVIRAEYAAPRTPTEGGLAGIWSELLKLDRVGRHDNFFELGGHSLLAMRVAARLRDTFGIELPLPTLFEVPGLGELAGRIDAAQRAAELMEGDTKDIIYKIAGMSEEEAEGILNSLVEDEP